MKRVGDLLNAFFDEGMTASAKNFSAFFNAWKRIAGDRLAAHSRIVELEGTILVIEADHPGWVQLIQMKRTAILETVRKQFPDLTVTALSIRLSKDGPAETLRRMQAKPPPEKVPARQETAAGEEKPTTADPYEIIHDQSFRDLLKRLEKSIKDASR